MSRVPASPKASVPTPDLADLWPADQAPAEIVVWDLLSPPPPGLGFVVTPYSQADDRLNRLRELPDACVVQALSAGVDYLRPHLPPDVTLCNAAGVHDAGTAELAIGLTLAGLRGIGIYRKSEIISRPWPPPFRPSLADRRVLLLGAGPIGRAVMDRLSPFEANVTRVARTAREDEHGPVHAVSELDRLLVGQEVVILVLPLDNSTHHMLDARRLALLPDGALVVNVGRGGLIDTEALYREARDGRIRAALDVTDPEPLPAEHPLWQLPEVLITPHVGGASTAFVPRVRTLLRQQIARFAANKELLNVV